jgi:sugar lactone lactonase YvrE
MTQTVRLFLALCGAASILSATETKTWSEDDYSDFEKGELKKLSLSSDGRVHLAPLFRELLDSSSVYLWALAEDSKGNLYAGGGGPGGPGGARIYAIAPNGKTRTVAELDDLEVHALAIDRQNRVYAATAPDGKVYRLPAAGKPEVFFDPKAKYIWGMAFDSRGNLFLATGDRGEIYRVTPDGKGQVFYKTTETHARSLAVDAKDNLIVGTEPGGLIIRVSPKGEGFVLYQSAKREITSVAAARDGTIYAAGVGNKAGASGGGAGPGAQRLAGEPMPALGAPQPSPLSPGGQLPAHTAPAPPAAPAPLPPPPIAGGSEVYRIDPDGSPRRVWSDPQQIAYTIGFDAEQRPLIGTGNKGVIYRLDSNQVYTELLTAPPAQVTALYAGPSGGIYAATGNVGKVYQIGPGLEKEGSLESDVLDAGMFSYWGRLSFRGELNGGRIEIRARSGNLDRPQSDWSPWSAAVTSPDGARLDSPPARFLQWRAVLESSGSGNSPEFESVDVAYLQKNVAPQVEHIEITPANYRFPPQSQLTLSSPPPLALPPLGHGARAPASNFGAESGAVSMQYAKGYIGARWAASDDNGDDLLYTVQIRGENETAWKPLKDKLTEKRLSWDSTAFPDGDYRIRVIASDAPGNPPDQALTGELVSDPFTIDNTPPAISALAAEEKAGKLNVRWTASDALSAIDKAEYSVNGGDWTPVDPVTRLSDSRREDYLLSIDRPGPGEQVIAVRVADEFDNQTVAKVVVK